MNRIVNWASTLPSAFLKDDEGAQVVEYALIIALISVALALVLASATSGISFSGFVDRITTCLGTGSCV